MLPKSKIIILFLFIVWTATPLIADAESWRYWKQGEVTRALWSEDGFRKIEIDKIPYTIIPDARFYQITKSRTGAFNETSIGIDKVYRTQRVEYLVQGFRIYQLKVLP